MEINPLSGSILDGRQHAGITEAEIAQLAIEAYYEAHMKAGVQRTLFVGELTRNFEALIAERFNVRVTHFE